MSQTVEQPGVEEIIDERRESLERLAEGDDKPAEYARALLAEADDA